MSSSRVTRRPIRSRKTGTAPPTRSRLMNKEDFGRRAVQLATEFPDAPRAIVNSALSSNGLNCDKAYIYLARNDYFTSPPRGMHVSDPAPNSSRSRATSSASIGSASPCLKKQKYNDDSLDTDDRSSQRESQRTCNRR